MLYYKDMGLYTKQEVERTELQKRVAEELQDKAKRARRLADEPDLVEDSAYMHGMKKTTSLAWLWVVIVVAAVALIVYSAVKYSAR